MNSNLNNMKKYITTSNITFLSDLDRTVDINKDGKSMYFKLFRINYHEIQNFILNLDNIKIYMANPFITINCNYEDPILVLSRPFLITNESNPKIIYDLLIKQFEKANEDFNIDTESQYFLIINYRSVNLNKKV
jgi:hypothetical protein